ncbi:MAG: hypothetical protein GX595_12060 [Lentisphaerae bacterium]|nr:hypothetical protein [Lentisphaerota bacterium]
MTSVAHWAEWKARCAAGLCSAEAQASFAKLGRGLMEKHQTKVGAIGRDHEPLRRLLDSTAPALSAWHLLETFAIVPRSQSAKIYKDYILQSGLRTPSDPAAGCRKAASIVMRSALREFARRECPDLGMVSLQSPVEGGGESAATLEQLLPAEEAFFLPGEEDDLGRHADALAPVVFDSLAVRERVALLATALGISTLADPRVVRAAGCPFQRLYEARKAIRRAIDRAIAARFPSDDEDPDALELLAHRTAQALVPLVFSWGKSEESCAPLFSMGTESEA